VIRVGAGQREPPQTLDRAGYELEVEDAFDRPTLNEHLWLPFYLPHWSSRAASAARYSVGDGGLRLRIDADQEPWCPEFDGDVRVSSLQTGLFAGPVGSSIGQHHFREGLVVREAQPNVVLYVPQSGLFELQARALDDPAFMVALWMIGHGDEPTRSAEICVCEVFGRDVGRQESRIGMGVHPFGDPSIIDEFAAEPLPIDARESHLYSAEWTPDFVAFYVDERLVKVVRQSPSYPMQFMLDIYEFRDVPRAPTARDTEARTFVVERFRGYRPVSGPAARPSAYRPRS
jgi:glycosyl hydrolase family 16